MGEDLDTEGKNEMTRPTLYTVHGFAVLIILLLVFFAGAKTGYVKQLLLDRDTLAQEIDRNAATMSALSDRLIQMEKAYTTTGLASYYAYPFHGRTTASMEIFDKDKLTAASRWLPLKTWWTVTRLDTGKSVRVWVNDRGPYIGNRIIDLSHAAAEAIGMVEAGVVKVEIRPER